MYRYLSYCPFCIILGIMVYPLLPEKAGALPDLQNVLKNFSQGDVVGGTAPPPPLGPPRPSSTAEGKLPISKIHAELASIYQECIDETNSAFAGDIDETREGTHNHLSCSSCLLKRERDWRCSPGVGWAGTDWCNDVEMAFEKNCKMPVPITDENRDHVSGYFECEIEDEWYVRLDNYFHYELDFAVGISRDLYQTAEIRVYCDGWNPDTNFGGGHIKVVQTMPVVTAGLPGHWESLLGLATYGLIDGAVRGGLEEQYQYSVPKMHHIINVEQLSGARCASLGIDGDDAVPLAERSIIWDVPPPTDVVVPVDGN